MKTIGVLAQCVWFAFGTWVGSIFAGTAETIFRDPPPQPTSRDIPIEWLIVLYIPLSVLLSLIFLGWIVIRSRTTGGTCRLPWLVPLVLGTAYLPVVFSSIPVLIWLTDQGQGAFIGLSIAGVLFGLPVVLGEIAFRIGSRTPASSPSGRS
jgi:hypothetical protein